jgi:hypothetical protein
MRIFQIAKELNISHKGIIAFLNTKGIIVGLMDSIDQPVYQLILNEFSKEKETVDRYRKEKVRKEIHDTRNRQKQKEKRKLKLLSISEQRNIEDKELQKKKVQDEKIQKQEAENKKKEKLKAEEIQKKKEEQKTKSTSPKGKKRKMRKIEIADIESEIGSSGRRRPDKRSEIKKKAEAPKNVKEMVKITLAKMETKSRKKVYKKEKDSDEEQSVDVIQNKINIPFYKLFCVISSPSLLKLFLPFPLHFLELQLSFLFHFVYQVVFSPMTQFLIQYPQSQSYASFFFCLLGLWTLFSVLPFSFVSPQLLAFLFSYFQLPLFVFFHLVLFSFVILYPQYYVAHL